MSTSHRIASIQCLKVRLPFDHGGPAPLFAGEPRTTLDSVWMRVTLEDGLVGWGEAYGADPDAVVSIVRTRVERLAMGRDATEPGLACALDRTLHNMGRSGPVVHALSGLDIALWDLRGKIAGVPVYQLLGGARRKRIPAYASLLQYYGDTALVASNVRASLEAGYRSVKLHERTVESVRAAREAMGAGVPLMLDTNCAWDVQGAAKALASMADYDLLWVEEPIWPPEDLGNLVRLREMAGVPTAVGENAASLQELLSIVRGELADYVQPSAIKSGGLTTLQCVSEAAAGTRVRHSPQSAFFGPGFLATLHVLAAQEAEVAVERLFCRLGHVPYEHQVPFKDGAFHLGDEPGLGAEPEPLLLSSAFVS